MEKCKKVFYRMKNDRSWNVGEIFKRKSGMILIIPGFIKYEPSDPGDHKQPDPIWFMESELDLKDYE